MKVQNPANGDAACQPTTIGGPLVNRGYYMMVLAQGVEP